MQKTITRRVIDSMAPGEIIADDKIVGFVVRKLPSGRPTFGYRYTIDGKRHWLSIGVNIAPQDARKAAQAHAGSVARDISPVSVREARRLAARSARTVNDVLDSYLKAKVTGQRSEREVISMLDRLVRPKIGKRPIDAVRRLELVEMLDEIAESTGKRTADKTLSVLNSAFTWWALRDDSFRSPIVRGMARLSTKDLVRTRVLSDDEIRSLWLALDSHPHEAYGRLVKALLLTAARRAEMGDLQGTEIADDVITVPAERVKTKCPHTIPVTPALAGLLTSTFVEVEKRTGREGDGYRFSLNHGSTSFANFTLAKSRLDAAIAEQRKRDGLPAMAPWRLHDLRRTARTLMARAGVTSDIAERVLGHKMTTIRGTYDHHDYLAEKRDALERLQALINDIIKGTQPGRDEIDRASQRSDQQHKGANQI